MRSGAHPGSAAERFRAPERVGFLMYEVLIVACLIASPADCKTFEVPLYHYETLHQCSVMAQTNVVEWATHEPRWRIRRFTCRSEERRVGKECVSTCRSRGSRVH